MTSMRRALVFGTGVLMAAKVGACTSNTTLGSVAPVIEDADSGPATADAGVDASDEASIDAGPYVPPPPPVLQCAVTPCTVSVASGGGSVTCALLADETVQCWGSEGTYRGWLGRGAPVSGPARPAPVVGLEHVTQLSVGATGTSCARTADGAIWCWGGNQNGELGLPTKTAFSATPQKVPDLPSAEMVAIDVAGACAIVTEDRSVWCWGWDSYSVPPRAGKRPTRLEGARGRARSIGIRYGTTSTATPETSILVLLENGEIDSMGTLSGRPSSFDEGFLRPLAVSGGVRFVERMSYATSGDVYAWSSEDPVPTIVPGLDGRRVVAVRARAEWPDRFPNTAHVAAAIYDDGSLYVWGTNAGGQLGITQSKLYRSESPWPMAGLKRPVMSVAVSINAFCASLDDGSVRCWGRNDQGQLGHGFIDYNEHASPELVQ